MKYLGIDFGLRRVGLAMSDGILASPLKVLTGRGFADLVDQIKKEAKGFDKLIIGMPEGKMAQNVKGVMKALRMQGLDVEEVDETLSSQKALEKMIEIGTPKKKRKVSDDTAAAIILQEYLDNQNR